MSEQGRRAAQGPVEDADLVARVSAGSPEALGALYDRHAPHMLGLALQVLGNRRDAEDLLHDVFLEVWRKSAMFDPERATARTWLLVMVRSRAIDRLRAFAVARRSGVCDQPELREAPDPDAELVVLRQLDRQRVLDALASLPPVHREIVSLLYLEGCTCREIAGRCGVPVGTVKSRLARALVLLRDRVAESGGVGG
jgi:RNA polymerase sigma-70 factor (ECF subfamily)